MTRKRVTSNGNEAEAKKALEHAWRKAPHSEFVRSCQEFFSTKGFLTQKQIEALEDVKAPWEYDNYDYDYGYDDVHDFDRDDDIDPLNE